MQRAIQLARRGMYTTGANPRVGCVITKDGSLIAEAWHLRYGEAHAEVLALKDAGDEAIGSTVYVTLEPCAHTGKTPPCVDALITSGVSEVYIAMKDPNPLVSGKGIQKLEESGIKTHIGLLEDQAVQLNPGFIKRMTTGLPFVRIKLAMSIDGRTAMSSGESRWITGEAARKDVQKLRARSGSIMTGIGTVTTDDPSLNVRINPSELDLRSIINQPLRVVLDSNARFSHASKMCSADGQILVYTKEVSKIEGSVEFASIPSVHDRLDLVAVLKDLGTREVNEILVEAGQTLCGSLLDAELVDEVVIYMAPKIMGNNTKGLFDIPGLKNIRDSIDMGISDVRRIGKDLRITMVPVYN